MKQGIQRSIFLLLLLSLLLISFQPEKTVFVTKNGEASFLSDAPLEIIRAGSKNLAGVLNIKDRNFSFTIPMNSFEGFNSSLQRIHFNEDYMESDLYPSSTFKGRLIEEEDLSKPGIYKIRAKGKLVIHGVENDRIIKCDLKVSRDKIEVVASFTVFIADYNIKIPSIVNQKIAEEIKVAIKFTMFPS
jgi:hypothetical protein